MCPGINTNTFRLLSIKTRSMTDLAKHRIVTFDEMSIKKELKYDPHHDEVDGLVHILERRPTACNQALAFMVRGLASNWKQPLAYYFSENAASAQDLQVVLGIAIK